MASKAQNRKKAEKVATRAMMGDTKPLELLAEKAEKHGIPFVAKDGTVLRTKSDITNHILHLLGV